MSKAVNAAIIDTFCKDLDGQESCVVVSWEGMNVAETVALRAKLRAQSFRMRVVKNTLAAVAFERAKFTGLGSRLGGQSAVIFGGEGAIGIAKLLVEEVKTNKKLKIRLGYCDGEVLDAAGVQVLSTVPGRKELMGMVLGGFFGPASDMARNLDGLFTEFHGLVEALETKKSAEGGS